MFIFTFSLSCAASGANVSYCLSERMIMWSDAPRLARQQKVVRTGSEQRCGVQHHPTGRCLVPLVGCLLLEAAGGCWRLLRAASCSVYAAQHSRCANQCKTGSREYFVVNFFLLLHFDKTVLTLQSGLLWGYSWNSWFTRSIQFYWYVAGFILLYSIMFDCQTCTNAFLKLFIITLSFRHCWFTLMIFLSCYFEMIVEMFFCRSAIFLSHKQAIKTLLTFFKRFCPCGFRHQTGGPKTRAAGPAGVPASGWAGRRPTWRQEAGAETSPRAPLRKARRGQVWGGWRVLCG